MHKVEVSELYKRNTLLKKLNYNTQAYLKVFLMFKSYCKCLIGDRGELSTSVTLLKVCHWVHHWICQFAKASMLEPSNVIGFVLLS